MTTISKIPPLFAIFILLSHNIPAHGTEELERLDMSQRASAALEEILSSEEFRNQDSQQSWWSKLIKSFLNYLPEEASWMSTMLEWVFYFTGAVLMVSIFIFIAKRLRRLPSSTTDHDVRTMPQRHAYPETVRMQAYECSQRGDYRRAIRYLYLSLLLYLDKAGLLTYNVGKTNGEYLVEAHTSMSDEVERFVSLTLFFERKWYGMEESSAGDFRQCEEAFVRLARPFSN